MKHWIVAASSSSARYFSAPGLQVPMEEHFSIDNAEARLREKDLTTDRAGKFGDDGPGAHGYGIRDTAVRKSQQDFARSVVDHIEKARAAGEFQHLSIVATPEFLGMMRKHMSPTTQRMVLEEVTKDLSGESAERIQASLTRLTP